MFYVKIVELEPRQTLSSEQTLWVCLKLYDLMS